MSTPREVINEHIGGLAETLAPGVLDNLEAALVAREDGIADVLRLAGQQFGLMPEIVAEVLAEVGLGTPPDEVTRDLIRTNYVALMERLQEEHRRQHGGDN